MDLRIINVTEGKSFLITNLDSITIEKRSGVTVMPIPELDEGETQLIKLQGVECKIDIEFKLVDSSVDLSEGTNGSSYVKTVVEQREFLLNYFVTPSFEHEFKIEEVGGLLNRSGVIESIVISAVGGEPIYTVRVSFLVGRVT